MASSAAATAIAIPETVRMTKIFCAISIDMAQNILVMRTVSGMAMAVAAALDAIHFGEVVGCIAGDDTIMIAVRSVEDTRILMGKIRELMKQ